MKLVQILNKVVNSDLTPYFPTKESIPNGTFSQEYIDTLVEAPDNVFIGWGYSNGQWLQPIPPDGWAYNADNGIIYPISAGILSEIQKQTYPKLYQSVLDGVITQELFKTITGEDFIEEQASL